MAFTQFIVLAIVAILVPSIMGMDFMVGDDKGWTTNFDYQAWAKGKEFHVGDNLGKLALQTSSLNSPLYLGGVEADLWTVGPMMEFLTCFPGTAPSPARPFTNLLQQMAL